MNIAQIRYFVIAAQVQNLSQAAELLHLSQPALSKSIAKLEEELGTPLFLRKGKRILLSKAGKAFLPSAWTSLRALDHVLLDLREQTLGEPARLTIGAYQADSRFTEHLVAFAALHPEVEIDITGFPQDDAEPDINRFDLLLYPDSRRFDKLHGYCLYDEPYLVAVPEGHPLADREQIVPEELQGGQFVFMNRGQIDIEEAYYLCAGLNLRVKTQYMTNLREQHRLLIAEGAAIGFVPKGCAGQYAADPRIRLLSIKGNRFSRRIMLCFKRDKHLSPIGLSCKTFLLERYGIAPDARPSEP